MALLYLIIWAACSDTELLSLLSALSFYFYIDLKLVWCHTNISTNILILNNSNWLSFRLWLKIIHQTINNLNNLSYLLF